MPKLALHSVTRHFHSSRHCYPAAIIMEFHGRFNIELNFWNCKFCSQIKLHVVSFKRTTSSTFKDDLPVNCLAPSPLE